ncbi:gamma-tubulin complex component 3 [Camelus ferus]|nr:gamma-tubulin complex component 3 [Camelus ferus]
MLGADVAQQFQYAVRVIGSNFAPTVERDEFLVAEKIKKELIRQRREADAALFSELHRKLHSQVSSYAALFAQALPRDAHSTPYYYARPQTLPLNYQDRGAPSAQSTGSLGSSGVSSVSLCALNGPTPTPQSLLPGLLLSMRVVRAWLVGAAGRASCGDSCPSWRTAPAALARLLGRIVPIPSDFLRSAVEVTEAALVRDVLYVFQGIDGRYVKMSSVADCYKVEGKSFCAALHQELREFYRLLSVLHSQLQLEDDQGVNLGLESSLTLRRLLVWTYDPKIRLKTLAALVDHCQGRLGRKGGELASAVHAYTKTGDPSMRSLVQHILSLVSRPVLSFLYRWIYDGELEDTHHEFFVASDPTVKTDRLWHEKYSLRKSMVPSFMTMDQARKQLPAPGAQLALSQAVLLLLQLQRDSLAACECLCGRLICVEGKIDAAYFETSKYLLDVLNKKYSLLDHMQAMRRYLLLGQGDFIRHLMDLLKPELVRPATTLYQHNLTGILETAVRATNAQFDSPEILKRLDVRLLEVSPGDTGWDVFSLDYHVDGPIATVFTRECMSHYLRVFNFLWRAKRMEYILTDIRKGHMCNARLLRGMPEFSGVLHHCHILASEMVHFIHQMQYYITFEVLECSWDELWNKVQRAQDLDHIIAAHEVFLDTIISRCLLDADSRIIELQSTQDAIYRAALEELQRRLQFEERKKQREVEGQWGMTAAEEEQEAQRTREFQESIPKMCSQLRILTHFYQGIVQQFLVLLTTSSDESLRFLSFRLDFNEHYRAREPRLRVSLGARGRRSPHTSRGILKSGEKTGNTTGHRHHRQGGEALAHVRPRHPPRTRTCLGQCTSGVLRPLQPVGYGRAESGPAPRFLLPWKWPWYLELWTPSGTWGTSGRAGQGDLRDTASCGGTAGATGARPHVAELPWALLRKPVESQLVQLL